MRRFLILATLLLNSCLPSVITPAYSTEGAASTGSFTFTTSGALMRQLSGTGYTTVLSEPSTGITLNLGVNEGMTPCVVSFAFARELRVASYVSFVPDSIPTELSFSSVLYCDGHAWTLPDASGTLEVTRADRRLAGQFAVRLTSERDGSVVVVRGRFNLRNPRG
jgi:hypothetical protein